MCEWPCLYTSTPSVCNAQHQQGCLFNRFSGVLMCRIYQLFVFQRNSVVCFVFRSCIQEPDSNHKSRRKLERSHVSVLGQVALFKAESCHRFLNTLAFSRIDVLAVAVFTGCYCSEAALVPLSSLHCLSSTISPPCSLFVISLTHLFAQLFLLVVLFSSPNVSSCLFHFSARLLVLFLLTRHCFSLPFLLPILPYLLWLSVPFSVWRSPCEYHQRGAETEPGVSLMNEVIQAYQTLLC